MAASEISPQHYVKIERDPSAPASGGRITFIVRGELDIANMDCLVQTIVTADVRGTHVVLDMSRLEFMDCSGFRALIEVLNALGPDGRLTVRRPSPAVRRMLQLVGAERVPGLVITT